MVVIRFLRSPEPTGTGINPSLADLEAGNVPSKPTEQQPVEPKTDPGTNEPPKPPETPTDPTVPPDKPADKPEDKPVEPPADDPDEPTESYYAVVDKITGRSYKIEYPENVDPETPEGTAFRESFIRDDAWNEYEQAIRQRDPRGYAYLLHRQNGGTDEEFFGDKQGFVLPTLEQLQASVDVQTQVYRQDLLSKGLEPDTVQVLVEKAIKDNKLLEKSTLAHTQIDKAQKDYLNSLDEANRQEHARIATQVTAMQKSLDTTIGDIGFIVPEASKTAFKEYVMNNLQITKEGKFVIVQEVDSEKFKLQVEALFLQYMNGDLSKVIQKKAKTEAAHRLKLAAEKTKTDIRKDDGIPSNAEKKLTLGEL